METGFENKIRTRDEIFNMYGEEILIQFEILVKSYTDGAGVLDNNGVMAVVKISTLIGDEVQSITIVDWAYNLAIHENIIAFNNELSDF